MTFYTPTLLIFPSFSNHEDLLLSRFDEEKRLMSREKVKIESKYIILNQKDNNVNIELVRELQERLSFAGHTGEKTTYVLVGLDSASLPAQNALLKILEEPPAFTHILLTAEHTEQILDTILSRCHIEYIKIENNISKTKESEQKSDSALTDRAAEYSRITTASLRELVELTDQFKEREEAIAWVVQISKYLHKMIQKSPNDSTLRRHLQLCIKTIQYLNQNCNTKIAIENCLFSIRRNLE